MEISDIKIPPLNENIISCLSAIYKNNISYESICEKISKDMGLIQKIFTIANSQLYSQGVQTNNLKDAIIRIGITNLTTILTSEYYNQYKITVDNSFFNLKEFNQHSIFVSKLCFEIAKELKLESKFDLMVAGMFHDIGLLIRAISQPEKMKAIIERCKKDKISFYSAELNGQVLTHDQIGAIILKKWNFTSQVISLVAHHHTVAQYRTKSLDYLSKELDILELANQIAQKLSFGSQNYDMQVKINQVTVDKLLIKNETLSKIIKDVVQNMKVFSSCLYV